MKNKIKSALVPAFMVSVVGTLLFGTPDFTYEIMLFIPSLLATFSIIYFLLSLPQCSNWTATRIKVVIWFMAVFVAVATTILIHYFVFTTVVSKGTG